MSLCRSLLALSLLLAAAPLAALTFTANTSLDLPDNNPGDGLCRSDGVPPSVCSLRAAIMEANATPGIHDINLQPGRTYTLSRVGEDDVAMSGDLDLHRLIRIRCAGCSPDGGDRPVVDAGGIDRVFDIWHAGVELEGFDVTGGYVTGQSTGAGVRILNNSSGVVLQSLRFHDNRANYGAAVYNLADNARIIDSEFFDNNRSDLPNLMAVIQNSGGVTIEDSSLHHNNAPLLGQTGVAIQSGGSGHLTVYNTTISSNSGVGIHIEGNANHTTRLRNVSLVNNNGTGLSVFNPGSGQSLIVSHSIIAGNGGLQCSNLSGHGFDLDGYNLASHSNCGMDDGATNLPPADPLLTPLKRRNGGGGTPSHWPRMDSPVLSAGSLMIGLSCRPTDQNGVLRPQGFNGIVRCDIGAAEVPDDAIFFDSLETL